MWGCRTGLFAVFLVSVVCGTERRQVNIASIPAFGSGKVNGKIAESMISEASGLAASRVHPGILYTHNDHGDGPRIFAINASDASLVAKFTITGAIHYDWEDMAVGPCEDETCIYIGDIGKGNGSPRNVIYRVLEPATLTDNQALPVLAELHFAWDESESETLLVDNDGEVYVIGRITGGRGMIAKLPKTAWGRNTPVNVFSPNFLPLHTHHRDPVAGDISPDGSGILIKAINHIYYFPVTSTVMEAFQHNPIELPYHDEHLGEAVCWSADGQNYYTLGEGHNEPLYQYTRLPGSGPGIVG